MVVLLEVPMAAAVVLFQEQFRHLDLAAEIRAGKIEELEDLYRTRQFARLSAGLSLRIDGKPASGEWQPTELFGNGYGLDGFFIYELRLAPPAALRTSEGHDITLRLKAFERETVMFAHLARSSSALRVLSSSVPQPPATTEGAELIAGSDEELALWSADEDRRVFRVSLGPP